MKEEIKITITLTDEHIILIGHNLQELTEDDSIEVVASLADALNVIWKGDSTDGNA